MRNCQRETRAVLGAVLLATGLTGLQLLTIGLALCRVGAVPEVPARRAEPALDRDLPAPSGDHRDRVTALHRDATGPVSERI